VHALVTEDDQDHDHKAQKETESEGNEAWIEIEKAIVIGDKKEEGTRRSLQF